jgi:hypothetical protein
MLWFGILLCAAMGIELGGVAAGALHLGDASGDSVLLFVICVNLVPWTGIAGISAIVGARKRASRPIETLREVLPTLEPVLAKIEASRAVGEGPDLPLMLELTVAPDALPGYRVEIRATVNLMDMDDYKVGRIVVARFDPYNLWRVEIPPASTVSRDWADRAANAAIDSAPIETVVVKPRPAPVVRGALPLQYRLGKYATLLGALASVAIFWKQFTG